MSIRNLLLVAAACTGAAASAVTPEACVRLADFGKEADAQIAVNDFGVRGRHAVRYDRTRGCAVFAFTNLRAHVTFPVFERRLLERLRDLRPDKFYIKYRAPEYDASTTLKLTAGKMFYATRQPIAPSRELGLSVAYAKWAWSKDHVPYVATNVTGFILSPEGSGTLEIYEMGVVRDDARAAPARPRDPTPVPADAFAVFPEPRHWRLTGGALALPRRIAWSADALPPVARAEFAKELLDFHGIELVGGSAPLIVFELVRELGPVKYDGFDIACSAHGIRVRALEPAGLAFAAETLAELIWRAGGREIPCFELRDWPRFPIRPWLDMFYCFGADPKYDVPFYTAQLSRFALASRYNRIGHYRAEQLHWSHPALPKGGNGWTQEDYAAIVDHVNGHGVRMLPSVQSLGHQEYCICCRRNAKRLGEDGRGQVLCTRNPETTEVLFSMYDDMIRLCSRNPQYRPDYFLTWHDEVYWQTQSVPEAERCPRCAGVPKNRLFLESVLRCRERLKASGLKTVIFTDMISEAHAGRNQFDCAAIVDEIPRDVVLASWSPLCNMSIGDFRAKGFENWKLFTGFSSDPTGDADIAALGIGLYKFRWWLSRTRAGSHASYGLLATRLQSYYAWREPPRTADEDILMAKKYGSFLMRGWSRKALRGKGGERDLGLAPVSAGETPVALPSPGYAASLVFTHGVSVRKEDLKAYFDRRTLKDSLIGPTVAVCEVRYGDGSAERIPMHYGWNVGDVVSDGTKRDEVFMRYLADCRRIVPNAGDTAVKYEYEWANPHPEKRIASVSLYAPEKTLAHYRLFALAAGVLRDGKEEKR